MPSIASRLSATSERQELVERQAVVGELTARLGKLRAERDEVEREEKRYDDSVAAIEARRAEGEEVLRLHVESQGAAGHAGRG